MLSASSAKIIEKALDFVSKKPGWALVFFVLTLMVLPGVTTYGASFFGKESGKESAISEALAELRQKDTTLASEIKATREAWIEEIVRLKEDGKLLSEDSIRLMIKAELEEFGDRLIKRLKERD